MNLVGNHPQMFSVNIYTDKTESKILSVIIFSDLLNTEEGGGGALALFLHRLFFNILPWNLPDLRTGGTGDLILFLTSSPGIYPIYEPGAVAAIKSEDLLVLNGIITLLTTVLLKSF